MKRRIAAISLMLVLCTTLACIPAFAEELWSEEYYRAVDVTGTLSEAERDSLDADCIAFMKEHRLDLALLAVAGWENYAADLSELANDHYTGCGFGYGEGRDGFLWLYDTNADRGTLFAFGAAEGTIPQDYAERMSATAQSLTGEHGVFGALYGGVKMLSSYLEDASEPEQIERAGEGSDLPAWYPASTENFPFFRDEDAPRVVDEADIFTDAEEQALEARIGEIRTELQRDIVIYTDVTDYGKGREAIAEDFFDYNGYGYGDEAEGVCLFIDMDPYDRGWWVSCNGSETMRLYTESVANLIDDALYEYMANGAYGVGVANWVDNIRGMYVKGSPFAPDWYPAPGEPMTRYAGADAPRVVDELGLLSDAELAELTEQAAKIAEKRGVDVAIHTMRSPVGMDYSEVSALYYTYMGYREDGILLTVLKRDGYLAVTRIAAFGSAADKLTETNEQRLRDLCESKTDEHEYYAGLSRWLTQTDHMLRTGRVARSTGYWVLIAAVCAAVGSLVGGVTLGVAKHKMAKPAEQRDADAYISSDSRIRDAGRYYLYTTTSRHYDPPREKSSGGGGGSGRSSYSGSHSGSSGRSHSGSGRSF